MFSILRRILSAFQGGTQRAKRLRRILQAVFLIVLFGLLFRIVPINRVAQAVLAAQPAYLAAGLAIVLLAAYLSALQMALLARSQGIQRSTANILAINLAAKFYSQFMPGTAISSILRWYRLAQPEGKGPQALATLVFFRLMELFLDISSGLIFWLASREALIQLDLTWPVLLLGAIPLGWLAATRFSLPAYTWLKPRLSGLWAAERRSWMHKPIAWLEAFLSALAAFANTPASALLVSIGAGALSQLAGVVSNYWIARAIAIDLPFLTLGWIHALVVLVTQAPVVGGLGMREVTLLAILPGLGVAPELALAYSLLLFARGLFVSLLGGLNEAAAIVLFKRPAELGPAPRKPG
jgi:hypothetical protein